MQTMYEDGYVQVLDSTQCQQLSKDQWFIRPAIIPQKFNAICTRCNQLISADYQLADGRYYCPFCLSFGRLTSRDYLCSKKPREAAKRIVELTWMGQLTRYQQHIADQLCHNYLLQQHTLIWAVTGAGKTEMLFPLIYQVLAEGKRVCLASPRIDVCLELLPRIQQAFQKEAIFLLYGDSEEAYQETNLLICTTHQLIHFYQSFDLLIIDEVDAFPYADDLLLNYATKQALKVTGIQVFLTATPSNRLLKEVKKDQSFAICKLPLRFHQRPLLQPKCIWFNQWVTKLLQQI